MTSIDSGQFTRSYTQTIEAPPDRVFPLLCPVREGEWAEGWSDQCQMIHSISGVAEEGCVFRTAAPRRPETIWMITRHDKEEGIVEFFRVTTGLAATRLTINVKAAAEQRSLVHIRYTLTPISAKGADYLQQSFSEKEFARDMAEWQDSMNHWLRTGTMLHS